MENSNTTQIAAMQEWVDLLRTCQRRGDITLTSETYGNLAYAIERFVETLAGSLDDIEALNYQIANLEEQLGVWG